MIIKDPKFKVGDKVEPILDCREASAYIEKVQALIDGLYAEMRPAGPDTMTYAQCADLILGVIFYDNWNGELPQVLTSDSLSALIGALIAG